MELFEGKNASIRKVDLKGPAVDAFLRRKESNNNPQIKTDDLLKQHRAQKDAMISTLKRVVNK